MLPLLLYKIKGYRAEELQYPTEYPHPGLCVSPHHKCSMSVHEHSSSLTSLLPFASASCGEGLQKVTPQDCRMPTRPACAPFLWGTLCSPHPAPPVASGRTPKLLLSHVDGWAQSSAVAGQYQRQTSWASTHPCRWHPVWSTVKTAKFGRHTHLDKHLVPVKSLSYGVEGVI